MKRAAYSVGFFLVLAGLTFAQRRYGGGEGGYIGEDVKTAREVGSHSTGTEVWSNPKGFEKDVFTFVRIRYDRGNFGFGGFGRGGGRGGWSTDTPDSDLNLSFRLQQMTSLKVDPDGRYIRLTDPELATYPFIYIVEPGGLYLSEPEALALRKYLLNGGFLLLDDFWGDRAWLNVAQELKKVFPERNFAELGLEHPLYHCVFEIKAKAQVPNVDTGANSQYTGVTWETQHDGDVRTVHHRAIFDDKSRIMVLALHNTDNGDGWEREGEDDYYFHNFSEKVAYPLGINIVFYVMTH
ncbi:MAG: DUF4159 domain-containing protein [Opitutaceae bacterium]